MLKAPSQVTANLIRARELIADESKWAASPNYLIGADRKYCAIFALSEVTGGTLVGMDRLQQAAGIKGIVGINFEGHAAVMQMFDRAIALSMEEDL